MSVGLGPHKGIRSTYMTLYIGSKEPIRAKFIYDDTHKKYISSFALSSRGGSWDAYLQKNSKKKNVLYIVAHSPTESSNQIYYC